MLTQKEQDEIRDSFPKCPYCFTTKGGRITKLVCPTGISIPYAELCDRCGQVFPYDRFKERPRPTIPKKALETPVPPPSAKDIFHLFNQGLRYLVFPITLSLLLLATAMLYVAGLVRPAGFGLDKEKFIRELQKKP